MVVVFIKIIVIGVVLKFEGRKEEREFFVFVGELDGWEGFLFERFLNRY